MGVPKFYRWISERYPCLSQVVSDAQIPEFDNLYLDMNGIIHNCSHPDDDDVTFRIEEEQIFAAIFNYIDTLLRIIKPKRCFFMAIDGVAPRAKMNQQRGRRFMSARTAELAMAAHERKGGEAVEGERFDSNCITPGTPFMDRLHKAIDAWVARKIVDDPLWRIRVIFSGHNCPGEGEHKIMDFIRAERVKPDYDPNTRHCMYGLDADLMMLGLSSHEPHFSLLREEVKFGRPPSKNAAKKGQKTRELKNQPTDITFHLLHLQLFREYLSWEFHELETKLSFPFDLENIIDDWVLMCFLIGNDFIPHLPNVHIHQNALPLLYKTYITVLPTLGGYMNEKGVLNLKRFETFLKELADTDRKCFIEKMDNDQFMDSKRGVLFGDAEGQEGAGEEEADDGKQKKKKKLERYADSDLSAASDEESEEQSDDAAFVTSDEDGEVDSDADDDLLATGVLSAEDAMASDDFDGDFDDDLGAALRGMDDDAFENDPDKCWSVAINNKFKRHRRDYYREKMKFGNISRDQLRAQAEGYIRAIQWNLHYYYHGCVSWSWFFPFHFAPYISDILNFDEVDVSFDLSEPFKPFEQLLAVLPAASANCLPVPLQALMKDDNSPILDFYPTDFETDLNGKVNDWEAVVLVPFIDQARLLQAMESKQRFLSADEKRRNTLGPHIQYTADTRRLDAVKPIRTEIDKDEYRLPRSKLVLGLLAGVKLDVHFPGFPTMCHIPHTAMLEPVGVKVFTQTSKKPSMLLKPKCRPEFERDLDVIAKELLDTQVYVKWPILILAKVNQIWDKDCRFFYDGTEIKKAALDDDERDEFVSAVKNERAELLHRYAIDTGPVERIAFCSKFLGFTYQAKNGQMEQVKQWSGSATTDQMLRVPLHLIVSNINVEANRAAHVVPISTIFPVNSKAFVIHTGVPATYGHPGIITDIMEPGLPTSRIVLKVAIYPDPNLLLIRKEINLHSLVWLDRYQCARRANVSTLLFLRIVGSMYLITDPKAKHDENPKTAARIPIGLNLKSDKFNKEIPDYSRKNGQYWDYSNMSIALIMEYYNKFRPMFDYIDRKFRVSEDFQEPYFAEEIWPNEQSREKKLDELKAYLNDLPTNTIAKIPCGTPYLDSGCIKQLEKAAKLAAGCQPTMKKLAVLPAYVFKRSMLGGRVLPDAEADFELFDRVTFVAEGLSVPCGSRGTVIGSSDDKLEVFFDRPFGAGYKIRSSLAQCYKVNKTDVLNITFALYRKGKEAELKKAKAAQKKFTKPGAVVTSGEFVAWAPPIQKQNKPDRQPESSGKSWEPEAPKILTRPKNEDKPAKGSKKDESEKPSKQSKKQEKPSKSPPITSSTEEKTSQKPPKPAKQQEKPSKSSPTTSSSEEKTSQKPPKPAKQQEKPSKSPPSVSPSEQKVSQEKPKAKQAKPLTKPPAKFKPEDVENVEASDALKKLIDLALSSGASDSLEAADRDEDEELGTMSFLSPAKATKSAESVEPPPTTEASTPPEVVATEKSETSKADEMEVDTVPPADEEPGEVVAPNRHHSDGEFRGARRDNESPNGNRGGPNNRGWRGGHHQPVPPYMMPNFPPPMMFARGHPMMQLFGPPRGINQQPPQSFFNNRGHQQHHQQQHGGNDGGRGGRGGRGGTGARGGGGGRGSYINQQLLNNADLKPSTLMRPRGGRPGRPGPRATPRGLDRQFSDENRQSTSSPSPPTVTIPTTQPPTANVDQKPSPRQGPKPRKQRLAANFAAS
ncbi:unnamed protein product, partial [Mesorhabditis spiculigera]